MSDINRADNNSFFNSTEELLNSFYKSLDYYEIVFNDKPKDTDVFTDFDDLDLKWNNDTVEGRMLNNIGKMKENKWYAVDDKEKKETIKMLMRQGLLPDIVFNEDFTKIKRIDTELCFKNLNR